MQKQKKHRNNIQYDVQKQLLQQKAKSNKQKPKCKMEITVNLYAVQCSCHCTNSKWKRKWERNFLMREASLSSVHVCKQWSGKVSEFCMWCYCGTVPLPGTWYAPLVTGTYSTVPCTSGTIYCTYDTIYCTKSTVHGAYSTLLVCTVPGTYCTWYKRAMFFPACNRIGLAVDATQTCTWSILP